MCFDPLKTIVIQEAFSIYRYLTRFQDSPSLLTKDWQLMAVVFNKHILTKILPNYPKLYILLIERLAKLLNIEHNLKDVWRRIKRLNKKRRCVPWQLKPDKSVHFCCVLHFLQTSADDYFQERQQNSRANDEEDDEVKKREELRRDRLDDIRKERNVQRSRPEKSGKMRRFLLVF